MNKRMFGSLVLVIICLHCSMEMTAQSEFKFDDYIEGGESALYYYLQSQHLTYPEQSIEREAVGLAIAELVLNENGKILQVNMVNSIDKDIDMQLTNMINGTQDLWKKNEKDTTKLYFQFRYRIITDHFIQANYQFIANEKFILPLFITAVEFGNNSPQLIPDDSLALWSATAIQQGDYLLAGQYLDEMIRRNPYSIQLYQLRISANSKLQNTEKVNDDLQKIMAFVEGLPLNQVIIADYKELLGISKEKDSIEVFMIAPTMPEYPGGEKALFEYIATTINYPYEARINGIQGRVFVSFIVDTDGYVNDIQVLRGIGGGCDEEAVRLVRSMDRWKPGLDNTGDPLKIRYNLPVKFSIGASK